ncbi:MAG: MFS transporter [Leptolyngbyaceae cyanobacterium MO_188.B28]|nr:MFS transporter [Leptolyngbyaceae cyanobacterium MO_188.B28]
MNFFRLLRQTFSRWAPALDSRVWILAAGRLLSQIGIGFTLFYAPIFFVDKVGLSPTEVGIGIGSGSISGILGRFFGGSFSDSLAWGRRRTLLLSAAISALADLVLVVTTDFSTFVAGNLLMGLGIGLYWPATEAVVADITTDDQRSEAYAIVRLADTMGLGVGVVLGGGLIALTGAYRALFVVDGITYLFFFAIVYWAIAETLRTDRSESHFFAGWGAALRDTSLMIYASVNIFMTGYISQIQSTLPVYLNQFVKLGETGKGFSAALLSLFFTGHIALAAVCQLPVARTLKGGSLLRALMLSAILWGIGFTLIWFTGAAAMGQVIWAGLALGVMAIAMAVYTPVASSLVVKLAPQSLRGVYLSVNSMCWAIGYLIGPPVGGWALDHSGGFADRFWLVSALSVVGVIGVLQYLDRRLTQEP